MRYTDVELRRWWEGLTRSDRLELIERVQEKAQAYKIRQMADEAFHAIKVHRTPEIEDLAELRKWA